MGDVFANVVYAQPQLYILRQANLNSNMPVQSLKFLIQSLLSQLPDDPSSVVITVKSDTDAVSPPRNGPRPISNGPLYDPAMVYILELCTVLALRDSETINVLGADVAEALQNVMRNASNYHHIMVSRTMYYVLHLLHLSYVSNNPLTSKHD